MFSRIALNAAKPARNFIAVAPARMTFQVRFLSKEAITSGTTGRKMPTPSAARRATAPMTNSPAMLTIQGGPVFKGTAHGANANVSGEAVFTTSLVGYPESMTDPSYRGQILIFTTPLIGNYGVPSSERDEYGLLRHFESPYIQCAGVVVADIATQYSHWTAVESLSEWCAREGVPIVSGVDTRALVTYLREQGSSLARISVGESYDEDEDASYTDPAQQNLVAHVSTKAPFLVESPGGDLHVALLDCGVKENILRSLVARGTSVTVLPHDYPIHKVAEHFDGVFISNGPGDPIHMTDTVDNLRQLMASPSMPPLMGICMGNQLIALAVGAKTIKLPFGNRSANCPALDLTTGQALITSQNHGYAVDASTLPPTFIEYFRNLNDGSNEGLMHKTRSIVGIQFHPEAKSGPLDTSYLFDDWLNAVRSFKSSQSVYKDNRPTQLMLDILSKQRVGAEPSRFAVAA
jgi:carbamoyl-phosphate synthase small subunit